MEDYLFKVKTKNTRLTCWITLKSKATSSLPEVFYKKGVFKNFSKFTGKNLFRSLFFNKVAGQLFASEFWEIFLGHLHGCFWTTIPKRHPWHCCNALVELDFTQPIDLVFLVLTINVQLLTLRKLLSHALHKKCPYSGLFWSSFSCIWTEYGEIRVSVRIQSECGKVGPRITTNTHTFHAVMDTLLNPFYATSLLLYPWKNQKIGGKKKAWNGLIQNNNL